jgi:hypothetical protein
MMVLVLQFEVRVFDARWMSVFKHFLSGILLCLAEGRDVISSEREKHLLIFALDP